MKRTLPLRLIPLEPLPTAEAPAVGEGDDPLIDRLGSEDTTDWGGDIARATSERSPERFSGRLEGLSVSSASRVSSLVLEKAAERAVDLGLPRHAFVLHAGLAWRHLERGKPRYFSQAIAALGVCRALADDLDEGPAMDALLDALSGRYGFFEAEAPHISADVMEGGPRWQ